MYCLDRLRVCLVGEESQIEWSGFISVFENGAVLFCVWQKEHSCSILFGSRVEYNEAAPIVVWLKSRMSVEGWRGGERPRPVVFVEKERSNYL